MSSGKPSRSQRNRDFDATFAQEQESVMAAKNAQVEELNAEAIDGDHASKLLAAMELAGGVDRVVFEAMSERIAQGLRAKHILKRWGMGIVKTDENGNVDASELHTASIVRGSAAAVLTLRILQADPTLRAEQFLGRYVSPEEAKVFAASLASPTEELREVKRQVSANKSLTRTLELAASAVEGLSVNPEIEAAAKSHLTQDLPESVKTGVDSALAWQAATRTEKQEALASYRTLLLLEIEHPDRITPTDRKKLAAGKARFPKAKPAARTR